MLTLKKHELTGHDVFELVQGRLQNEHWLESSIYITDECFGSTDLGDILLKTLGNFNYYGPTEVRKAEWEAVKREVQATGSEITRQLAAEIDPWAEACFKNDICFTICGI